MKDMLQGIASHTARGVLGWILYHRVTTNRQELMAKGYTKTVLSEAIAELEVAGIVIRLKGGMYRVIDTALPAQDAGIAAQSNDAGIPAHDAARPASLVRTEAVLESKTKRKYGFVRK